MILFLALYVCVSFVQTRCQLMARKLSKVCRPLFQLCRTLSQYSHNILVSDQNQNSVFTEVADNVLWGKESLGATMVFLTSKICDQYSWCCCEKCEFSPQHSQTKRVCAIVRLVQCQTLLAFEGLAVQDPWWTKCFSRCYRRRGPPPPPIPAPPPPPPPPVYFFTCRLHLPCSMSARNNLPRSLTPPLS